MYWKKSPQPDQKEKPLPKLIDKASKQVLFIHALIHYSHALPQLLESRAKKIQF